MVGMAGSGLHALVERLEALLPTQITLRAVQERIAESTVDDAELARYVEERSDHYARHLVHRSAMFDVAILTWKPGQMTPIHNHAGNLGWVQLLRGRIVEDRYMLVPKCMPTELDLAPDVPAPQGGIELHLLGRTVLAERGAIATVDRLRAIHRIGNPVECAGGETAVTLHVYSKPHDVCLMFDASAKTCTRRELRYDNVETSEAAC